MTFYEDLVMQTQANYSRYHSVYAAGDTPYALTERAPLPYAEQIDRLARELAEADCVVVGGASGLSAAGGGDASYVISNNGSCIPTLDVADRIACR